MKNIARVYIYIIYSTETILMTIWKKITRIIFRNLCVCVSVLRENQCLILIRVYVPPFLDDSLISNVRNNVFESCLPNIQFQMVE